MGYFTQGTLQISLKELMIIIKEKLSLSNRIISS